MLLFDDFDNHDIALTSTTPLELRAYKVNNYGDFAIVKLKKTDDGNIELYISVPID